MQEEPCAAGYVGVDMTDCVCNRMSPARTN